MVFRDLRTQKNFSLSTLELLSGVSKATISQFENGKSLVSFDKLEALLECMNLTILDYSLLVNNGIPEYFIVQFQDITKAFFEKDMHKLKEIYEKNLEYDEETTYLIAISAKATFTTLSCGEIKEVESLLSTSPLWGLYEFYILIHTIDQLSVDLVWNLIQKFFNEPRRFVYLKQLREYRALLINVLIKAIPNFIEQFNEKASTYTLDYLHSLFLESDLTSKVFWHLLGGCHIYIFDSKERGEAVIDECLAWMTRIGARKLSNVASERIELLKQRTNIEVLEKFINKN